MRSVWITAGLCLITCSDGSQRPCEQMSSENQIADNEERMLEKHSHGFFLFFPVHVDPRGRRRCCQAMTHARSLKTHRRSCDHSHEINITEKDAVCTMLFIYCPINMWLEWIIQLVHPQIKRKPFLVILPEKRGKNPRKPMVHACCWRLIRSLSYFGNSLVQYFPYVSCPIRPKLWVAIGAGCTCRIAAVHQQPAGFQNGRLASAPQLIAGLDDAPCYCFTECTHAASTNALRAAVTNAL